MKKAMILTWIMVIIMVIGTVVPSICNILDGTNIQIAIAEIIAMMMLFGAFIGIHVAYKR